MYADDHNDTLPAVGHPEFVDLAKRSAGLPATPPDHKLFTCPDDQFYYATPHGTNEYIPAPLHQNPPAYSSYTYNSGNLSPNSRTGQGNLPGIAGRQTSSIREPAKTVLVGDMSAWQGFSWHDPQRIRPPYVWCFDSARNMIGFVDGHVSYTKIHFNLTNGLSSYYDPPPGYGYKWSGD
jgi:prepilin-type processing-associated H-X9-DG protein